MTIILQSFIDHRVQVCVLLIRAWCKLIPHNHTQHQGEKPVGRTSRVNRSHSHQGIKVKEAVLEK